MCHLDNIAKRFLLFGFVDTFKGLLNSRILVKVTLKKRYFPINEKRSNKHLIC